jgi:plastocyanin
MLPIAGLLVASTALAPSRGVNEGQVTVHTVQISFDAETGTFEYSLDPVRAAPGDLIEWNCDQGSWSVHFVSGTPLTQQALRGKRREAKRLPVRPNAEPGTYKYSVAVAIGEDVFIDDPEVVIGPG